MEHSGEEPTESRFNGRTGEWLRTLMILAVAAVVAFFAARIETNDRIAETNKQIAEVNGRVNVSVATEISHFEEVQRSLLRIERFMERIEATGADRRTGEPYAVQGRQR
jgi:hypothetical protein